jgi:hypothetical protein
MAAAFGVPFLGRVPIEPALARACEAGTRILPGGSDVMRPIVDLVLQQTGMQAAAEEAAARAAMGREE